MDYTFSASPLVQESDGNPSVNIYQWTNQNHLFYSQTANRWFALSYTGSSPAHQGTLGNNIGWHILEYNMTSQSDWVKSGIIGPTGANQVMDSREAIMPWNGLQFGEQTPPTLNEMSHMYDQEYHAHPSWLGGTEYLRHGNRIDVAWDESSLILHAVHYSNTFILYSKWLYDIQLGAFTQLNANTTPGDVYTADVHYGPGGPENQPFDFSYTVHPPYLNEELPFHRFIWTPIVALDEENEVKIPACLYTYDELNSSPDIVKYKPRSEHYFGNQQKDQIAGCRIHLRANGLPVIAHNSTAKSPTSTASYFSTGIAYLLCDATGDWTTPGYSAGTIPNENDEVCLLESENSRDISWHVKVPSYADCYLPQRSYYGSTILTLYPPAYSDDEAWHTSIRDINNLQVPGNYDGQVDPSTYAFGLGPNISYNSIGYNSQIVTATLSASNDTFVFAFMPWEVSEGQFHLLFNYGKMFNDGLIEWKFDEIFANTQYGQELQNFGGGAYEYSQLWTDNYQTFPGDFKVVVNNNSKILHIFIKDWDGNWHAKKWNLDILEELFMENNSDFPDSIGWHTDDGYLWAPLGASTMTLHSPQTVPVSQDRIPMISHMSSLQTVEGLWKPMVFDPGIGTVFDFGVEEIQGDNVICSFSLEAGDEEHIVRMLFKKASAPLFTNDFVSPDESELLEDLDQQSFTENNTERIRYFIKLSGFQAGMTYYAACKPVLDVSSGAIANMSNQATIFMPETSIAVDSRELTVPMVAGNGSAMYIGTGSGTNDRPKFVGRLTHNQFGHSFNSIHVLDAECTDPTGSTGIVNYDNVAHLLYNSINSLKNWVMGWRTDGSQLFFTNKDTGATIKTNQLGIKVTHACDRPGRAGYVWVVDESTLMLHTIKIDIEEIGATNVEQSWNIDYVPEYAKHGNVDQNLQDYEAYFGGNSSPNISDFAGQAYENFRFHGVVETGDTSESYIFLLARTISPVAPGKTVIIRANTSSPGNDLEWEDAMFPWNPTFNLTEHEDGPGESASRAYNRLNGFATSGLTQEARGRIWNSLDAANNPGMFSANPYGHGYEEFGGTGNGAEIHNFSIAHGPHLVEHNGGAHQAWGIQTVENTLVVHDNATHSVGFLANFHNIKYLHLFSHWKRNGADGTALHDLGSENEYHSLMETAVEGYKYVTVDKNTPGWSGVYTGSDVASEADHQQWTGLGIAQDSTNKILQSSAFSTLNGKGGNHIYMTDYNVTSPAYITKMERTVNASNGLGTNLIAEEYSGDTGSGTKVTMQECIDYSKAPFDTNPITPSTASWPFIRPMRLDSISSTAPAADQFIYGKVEIVFDASMSSLGVANYDNIAKNHGFRITGITTPQVVGGANLFNSFKVVFWDPEDNAHVVDPAGTWTHAWLGSTTSGTTPTPMQVDYSGSTENSILRTNGLLSDNGFLGRTLLVNKRFSPSGTPGTPTGEHVVDTIVTAYNNSLATAANQNVNPWVNMQPKGASGPDARTLVVYFLYPQSNGLLGVDFDTNTEDNDWRNQTSSTITTTDGTPTYSKTVSNSGYQNALIFASSDNVGVTYSNDGFDPGDYDEQYRILSRSNDIILAKYMTKQDHVLASGGWADEALDGTADHKHHYANYTSVIGDVLTSTPGSLSIAEGLPGTYHEGLCVGNSTHDNNENACIADTDDDTGSNYFSRTGSAKFDPGKKYYYRMSYTYDGFQESPLGQEIWTWDMDSDASAAGRQKGLDSLELTIRLQEVPKRVTHITLWRKDDEDEALFRSVEQVSLSEGWISDGLKYQITITDEGKEGPSYEALIGMSSTVESSALHYEMATVSNNMMFVGRATIKQTSEHMPNFVFRSLPGNFSMFNWANDYCKLPNIPNAIMSMGRALYAWDDNRMFIIDPLNLFVQETYEGIGCISKESVIVSETGMFWFDKTNVYLLPRAGGIDYVGSKILTSEHGIGWQEQSPNYPYKAIFDPKRKAFGMVQLYAPTQYYMQDAEEGSLVTMSASAPQGSGLTAPNINYLCTMAGIPAGKGKLKDVDLQTIADMVYNNDLTAKVKLLQRNILSKEKTKAQKQADLQAFVSKNRTAIQDISTTINSNASKEWIAMLCIFATTSAIKNRSISGV